MSVAEPQPAAPKPKLRWFQYSLRTLLIVVTLCAIPCSWLAVKMQEAKRQRKAAAALKTFGVTALWSEPSGPAWLRTLLGNDVFSDVTYVKAYPRFNGHGLENLKGLPQIQTLDLCYTEVTDAELENLKGLNQLRELSLWGTRITDAGLENIRNLKQLEGLNLHDTQVTGVGLENLTRLNRLHWLDLCNTKLTEAGLEALSKMKQLQDLSLFNTRLKNAQVKKLRQALPNCKIDW